MSKFLQSNKKKLFITLGIIALVILINLIRNSFAQPEIHPLTKSWEKAVPNQELPQGLASMSAAYCGSCHQQYYEEWKYSTHSHAWTDLQFQAELRKESSPFLCINCHIPLQNQQELIVDGLIDGDIYQPVTRKNPHFDEQLQLEGITCASCHVRNNAVIATHENTRAPHAVVQDADFLSEKLCISCHNASAVVTPSLVCTFETGDEWKAGPYYPEKTCISCHMETMEREIVPGYGEKQSHYHAFPGSGIPKLASETTKGLNGMGIYPSPFNSTAAKMDSIIYKLTLINEFAGHNLPTGDPERFYNITFTLKNEKDSVLANQMERIGEEWQWHPIVEKLSDNNLKPKEERTYTFSYLPLKEEQLKLSVEITKHRLNQENAAYNKLPAEYPLFITIFDKEYTVEVK
ncbi:MAG: multiheme c-type cytochrome [Saprospiraceae bacterium]|nr:hypothetical protein [Lewinella sp.]